MSVLWRALGCAAAGALVVTVLRREYQVARVRGASMTPTLRDGEVVLGRRRFSSVLRGSVVVFEPRDETGRHERPGDGFTRRIKRVVAIAGDSAPPWLTEGGNLEAVVPEGHVALDGDSQRSSSSAQFGYVPVTDIESVVVRRLATRRRRGGRDRTR